MKSASRFGKIFFSATIIIMVFLIASPVFAQYGYYPGYMGYPYSGNMGYPQYNMGYSQYGMGYPYFGYGGYSQYNMGYPYSGYSGYPYYGYYTGSSSASYEDADTELDEDDDNDDITVDEDDTISIILTSNQSAGYYWALDDDDLDDDVIEEVSSEYFPVYGTEQWIFEAIDIGGPTTIKLDYKNYYGSVIDTFEVEVTVE